MKPGEYTTEFLKNPSLPPFTKGRGLKEEGFPPLKKGGEGGFLGSFFKIRPFPSKSFKKEK
jgi:hypothetical protein